MGKEKTHVSKIENRGDGAPWSELNHDVLFLVMMELGVFDFLSFSTVCKSWRSLAFPNKIRFMESKPPMELLLIPERSNNTDEYSLVDFGGRSFKIQLPKSGGRTCVGLTCGYLVFFGAKPRDFMLLNPITRHGIHFPNVPSALFPNRKGVRAILVFSPSRSAWVFVVLCRYTYKIWFSIAGKGEQGYVSSNYGITDLHEFKGKIYAIDIHCCLYELRLNLEPKPTLLKTKNTVGRKWMFREFVSSGENLYVLECISGLYNYNVQKLEFGEVIQVSPEENSTEGCVFFVGDLMNGAAFKQGLWSESNSRLRYKYGRFIGKSRFLKTGMWYFHHDCLKVNFKHE